MRHKHPEITQDFVRKRFIYDPENGTLIHRKRDDVPKNWNTRYAGKPAQSIGSHGYPVTNIFGTPYLCHRLVWLYVYGEWPINQIDHINMQRADFRLTNIRLATNTQNTLNRTKHSDNSSGYKGVDFHKRSGKWRVRARRNGKDICIGYFKTIEEAASAYVETVKHLDGEFLRL